MTHVALRQTCLLRVLTPAAAGHVLTESLSRDWPGGGELPQCQLQLLEPGTIMAALNLRSEWARVLTLQEAVPRGRGSGDGRIGVGVG